MRRSHLAPKRRHPEVVGVADCGEAGSCVLCLLKRAVHGELSDIRSDAVMSIDHHGQRRFVDDFGFRSREVETILDVGFVEFQPAYSVGIDAARIGFHESPGGHVRLCFRISQLFEDLLGVGC